MLGVLIMKCQITIRSPADRKAFSSSLNEFCQRTKTQGIYDFDGEKCHLYTDSEFSGPLSEFLEGLGFDILSKQEGEEAEKCMRSRDRDTLSELRDRELPGGDMSLDRFITT